MLVLLTWQVVALCFELKPFFDGATTKIQKQNYRDRMSSFPPDPSQATPAIPEHFYGIFSSPATTPNK
jgi:hypothetical protein